ncbi:MAG: thiamine-monophosphate kinase [Deltaproteobacteria bacterium]|nr:thiamine-monophosphate kinase [Deltaproteobacteria bacterium]
MRPDLFDVHWMVWRVTERIADIGEFGLIRRISDLIDRDGIRSERVAIGIGDDTASFRPRSGYEVLVTCDALVEGRHFLAGQITPFDLGRRAMTVNVSDIGAMGGRPLYALISLGLKAEMPVRDVEEMYRGFLAELNPFSAAIIGGNFTKCGDAMFIDITVIGEVEQGKGVRRSGAQPGDAILVTGYPGQSAAGLQFLLRGPEGRELLKHPLVRVYNTPSHRAQLGAAIAQTGCATAMIDTSDGFLGDLGHICEESRVGAELFKEKIPVSEELREAARTFGRDVHDFFLGESDDYELVITCKPQDAAILAAAAERCGVHPLTEIGRITAGQGVALLLADGERRELRSLSWDHFRVDTEHHNR